MLADPRPIHQDNVSRHTRQVMTRVFAERTLDETEVLTLAPRDKARVKPPQSQCHYVALDTACERKHNSPALLHRKPVQEVRLVLGLVNATTDLVPVLTARDSSIVATRDLVGMQLVGYVKQALPLDPLVAEYARIRRGTVCHCLPEGLDHSEAKVAFTSTLCHSIPSCSHWALARLVEPMSQQALCSEKWSVTPNDVFTELFQKEGRDSRIHTPAHSDNDTHGRNPAARHVPGLEAVTVITAASRCLGAWKRPALLTSPFLWLLLDVKP